MSRWSGHLQFAGAVTLLVVALLHTFGHASETPPEMTDLIALEQQMASVRIDMGFGAAWEPSVRDIFDGLSLTMSIALAFMGLVNLAALAGASSPGGQLLASRIAWLTVLANGALVAIFLAARVAPPAFTLAVAEVLLVMSAGLRARGAGRV